MTGTVSYILSKKFTKSQTETIASGIQSVTYDETTSTITVTYTNGSVISYQIPTLVGRGIKDTVLNEDYTLTITYTDDTTYTTPSIRGETGEAAGVGTPVVTTETLPAGHQATVNVTATGPDTAKVFEFDFGIPEGKDGANVIEAGTGIAVDYDAEEKKYTITNTQTSAEWGNIEGDIEDQEDLQQALSAAGITATWGSIDGTLSTQTDLNSALTTKADLVNGRVPLQQLPEFIVADVVEVQTYDDLPVVGESHTLYHVILTDSVYRWVGAGYVQISQKSQYFSLAIDSNITTMGQLKDKVDSVNAAGDHVFFDLHQLVNEGYVCTVHFWDETVSGTVHHYCEINDLLNDRLYGIKQEWTSSQLVSNYCSATGLMYDIKKISLNGTALINDHGFVNITDDLLDDVKYSAQTRSDSDKAQARTNIGAGEPISIEVW